jgi:hypothetical protein
VRQAVAGVVLVVLEITAVQVVRVVVLVGRLELSVVRQSKPPGASETRVVTMQTAPTFRPAVVADPQLLAQPHPLQERRRSLVAVEQPRLYQARP